jgi:hypothetical protein
VYTETNCEQLAFASDKGFFEAGKVIEIGSSQWDTKLNRFMKARVPGFMIAKSATEMFSRLQVADYTSYPSDSDIAPGTKSPVVCAFNYLQGRIDILKSWRVIHDITEVNGYMLIAGPIGVTATMSALTVNQIIHVAAANDYGVPYLTVSNSSRQFVHRLNSQAMLTTDQIRENLYKFKEAQDVIISVIFKKMNDDPFKY